MSGKLNISEAVIGKIAQLVVNDVEGVYSMAPSPSRMRDVVLRSERNKPILTKMNAGVAEMDIYVVVRQGYKIKEVAEEIQEYVKEAVQNMTAITVSKVNVYVQDVKATVE
ncbi:MAG: Asp23/Gls24 family envelope stress response protein [Massilimaliae sp.]|nr:Asp23/Gls24 family envelope stress response protein [Massiliimalia sp.]